ncbi:MAG: hypothetical protein AB7S70_04575 [Hyphomicrobium sp.]|uniref:hypothetical protein n=1 Tax=Hyphomicrobium sp. TaxID=82 RepID=UPI003D119E76
MRKISIGGVRGVVALLFFATSPAFAGEAINESGAIACFTDKWDETEPEKGHKLVDYASRCVIIPDDEASPKVSESCAGTFEYMPDGSWKGNGGCTDTYKSGDTKTISWEEGSQLKEYVYKVTGGTGKFEGATGGGTYMYESLTDKLAGGRQKGEVKLR